MARILAFADLHAHLFKPYATLLPNGMNSRLADAVSCIDQIREYALKYEADLIVFAGDMFHVRRTIYVAAFNAVYEAMARLSLTKIPTVMIHGNHDQLDRDGQDYSVYAFNSLVTVADKPGWIPVETKNGAVMINAIPYMENVEHLRHIAKEPCEYADIPKVMLGHFGVQGAIVGADFVYPTPHDAKLEDLSPHLYDQILLGHFHKRQKLGDNTWYIGAPLHHNWGDRDDVRGFIIYDTETKEQEFFALKAPRFVELVDADLQYEDDLRLYIKDCFVRLKTADNWSQSQKEDFRTKYGARTFELTGLDKSKLPNAAPRLQVDPITPVRNVLEKYVSSGLSPADDLDTNYLLQLGYEIMQEVETSG